MSTLSLNDFRYADRSTDRDSDTSFLVEGVPHNFAQFDVIAIRAAGWIDLAVANADNIILAVVTKVIGSTSFIISTSGSFYVGNVTDVGLLNNQVYYLSNTTAGKVVTSAPASFVYPVFYTRDNRVYLTIGDVYGGASILSKLNALTVRVTTLEGNLSTLTGRVAAVESVNTTQNNRLAALEANTGASKAIRLTYTYENYRSWSLSTSYGYITGSGVSHTLTHNLNMLANTGKILYYSYDAGQGGDGGAGLGWQHWTFSVFSNSVNTVSLFAPYNWVYYNMGTTVIIDIVLAKM